MEHIYQYSWIIPLVTLLVPMLIRAGLLLFPAAIKKLLRMWAFPSVFLLILITTGGILVLFYSDNYMSHDQGYLRFFAYMSFFTTSMLGLVTSFWFTRPIASNACQKAFVTNRVGDFGLLLGILGLYWITGRPTPISTLIHAATMVAAGIFLIARLFPLFVIIPFIMNLIALIGIIIDLDPLFIQWKLFLVILQIRVKNMVLMGSLTKHMPITKTTFLLGTLSLCGIPPFACFWSKDEILNDTCFTAGLTAFYMFRVYLLTFDGYFNAHFQSYSGKKNSLFYSISLWALLTMNNKERASFFWKNTYQIDGNVRNMTWPFITIQNFNTKRIFSYPHESDNTMLFPMLILVLFTLFIGAIGIPFNQFNQEGMLLDIDILSKLLTPSLNLLHQNPENSVDCIAFFGIFIASFLYKPVYSSLQNLNFFNSFAKKGYIDAFYAISFIGGIRKLAELIHFFYKQIIDGTPNGVGVTSFFVGEGIKNVGSEESFYVVNGDIFLCIISKKVEKLGGYIKDILSFPSLRHV
ncbi:hypothetical protein MANES_18G138200v8 [Manihot esculenta]|uniref:Uncharacterized protein n=1 Tax=Manihot esculenta TaxID=3983 RepID=A0ACB7G0U7_MANES|nr:hypothetical protein MANES_18G138200v8 [Manihot esculenta]